MKRILYLLLATLSITYGDDLVITNAPLEELKGFYCLLDGKSETIQAMRIFYNNPIEDKVTAQVFILADYNNVTALVVFAFRMADIPKFLSVGKQILKSPATNVSAKEVLSGIIGYVFTDSKEFIVNDANILVNCCPRINGTHIELYTKSVLEYNGSRIGQHPSLMIKPSGYEFLSSVLLGIYSNLSCLK